jgi:hypothetical protein
MSTAHAFGTPVIGQTEKALNAILARQLAGTGLTEPQWVTLTLTVVSGGTLGRHELAGRVAGVLKVSEAEAHASPNSSSITPRRRWAGRSTRGCAGAG